VSDKQPASGDRILVVDDEPDIIALVAYHLVKHGYRVSTASDGNEAVRAAKQELPALIILDLMLPGQSGYEVLESLRANPATKDTAVLMLTARKEEEDRIRGLALGADDYLTKPFSPQELVLRVAAILRRMTKSSRADVLTVGPIEIDRVEQRRYATRCLGGRQTTWKPVIRAGAHQPRMLGELPLPVGHVDDAEREMIAECGELVNQRQG